MRRYDQQFLFPFPELPPIKKREVELTDEEMTALTEFGKQFGKFLRNDRLLTSPLEATHRELAAYEEMLSLINTEDGRVLIAEKATALAKRKKLVKFAQSRRRGYFVPMREFNFGSDPNLVLVIDTEDNELKIGRQIEPEMPTTVRRDVKAADLETILDHLASMKKLHQIVTKQIPTPGEAEWYVTGKDEKGNLQVIILEIVAGNKK